MPETQPTNPRRSEPSLSRLPASRLPAAPFTAAFTASFCAREVAAFVCFRDAALACFNARVLARMPASRLFRVIAPIARCIERTQGDWRLRLTIVDAPRAGDRRAAAQACSAVQADMKASASRAMSASALPGL